MQNFINHIIEFIVDISNSIYTKLQTYAEYRIKYPQFLDKTIFTDNSLIGINLTWQELIVFFGTWFLTILIIILFVKFVLKMLKVITN